MKVAGSSDKALRFHGANADLFRSNAEESGVLIWAVETHGNWLSVMIEVGENTTSDDLRKAIPWALRLRDRLLEQQGPWQHGGDTPFLEELCYWHDSGHSYEILAERINETVANYLLEAAKYLQEYEAAQSQFKTQLDVFLWQSKLQINPYSFQLARGLLEAVRLKDDEIDTVLLDALENIRSGRLAFEKGYPVSRDKLRETLRRWRESKKHQIIAQQEQISREKREGE